MASATTFIVGNPEGDFFEQNPQLRYFPATQQLLSSAAENASKLMWAVYLTEDPESKYYALPYEERRRIIAENYLKDPGFDWESVAYLVEAYPDMSLSRIGRWYKQLSDQFERMVQTVSTMDTIDQFKDVLSMYEKLDKVFKGLEVVENAMQKEKAKSVEVRGASQPGFFQKT
jgi:hypothetical protein